MALILEVLDLRSREVRARVRLDALPLAVGRGLDNDLVLDDPYVDGRHARIDRDDAGGLVMEDQGSRNGLMLPGRPGPARRVTLGSGTEVRLGRTTLRFRDSRDPVPPALAADVGSGPPVPWHPPWSATRWPLYSLTAAATLGVAGFTWTDSYGRETASEVFWAAIAFLVLVMGWAGLWAVGSRIVVHRVRFLEHLALASAVVLGFLVVTVASEWSAFVFPDSKLADPIESAVSLALIAALIAEHLALASAMSRRRCWAAGVVTCGILLLVAGVGTLLDRSSFSDVAEFSGELKPLRPGWIPAGSVEGFEAVALELKEQVDALAAKQRPH